MNGLLMQIWNCTELELILYCRICLSCVLQNILHCK